MKRFVCFLGMALALIPVSIRAGWTRTYGGQADDEGYCGQQTSDGGYIVSGYSSYDMWLLKIDEEGDTLWTTDLFEGSNGKAYSVQQTSDGGYIVTGYVAMTEDGKYHLCLFKTDASGDTLWSRFDWDWFSDWDSTGGVGRSVRQTSDKGFIITGYRSHWYEYVDDLWLIKTDENGDTLWTRTYGAEGEDCGHCVRQTSDGGYIITGYSELSEDDYLVKTVWLLRTDETGDTLWTRNSIDWLSSSMGRKGEGYCVEGASDGGYIVTGYVAPLYDNNTHLLLVKTDSAGDTLWWRLDILEWLPPEWHGGIGYCVQQTTDGSYIIAGCTSEEIGVINDLVLIKTDEAGDTLWTRLYGGDGEDVGYCVNQTSDDGYIITGATKSFGVGGYDIWLLKTDSLGDTLSGIEESVMDAVSNWNILSPVGREIVLRYEDNPQGFHASVFDAVGRRVDEIESPAQKGVLTWGGKHSPGVYFIKEVSNSPNRMQKVILIR